MPPALTILSGTLLVTAASTAYTNTFCPDDHTGEGAGVMEAAHVVEVVVEEEYETPKNPGLAVGDAAPALTLLNEQGQEVELKELWGEGPIVVNFYRGHWCPYCTRALSAWQEKIPELTAAGGPLVGLTPEKPTYVAGARQKHGLEYVVLSDSAGEAGRSFKVQFSMDEDTIRKYKGYGIDLTMFNSEGEWTLPAPATFVIDTEGVVQWVWADWDYSKRADPDDVIEAVKKIAG